MKRSIQAMVVVAVAALAALAGCSSDDGGGPVGTPVPTHTRTSTRTTAPTNTSGPTATPTPQPVAGEYSATLDLGEGATAEIEFEVDAEGEAEGTVVLEDPTAGDAAGAGGAAALISIGVLGTVDTETGAFDLGGTFEGVTVQLTGFLPGAGRTGTVTLTVNGESYTGPLGIVVPTATATSEVPVATPTPTAGGGEATPTVGLINGLSTDLIGTWAGTAENESTGVEKAVRLRVAASGSNIVVTDLNGNIFHGSTSVTVVVRTPMAMSYNAFGPPVIVMTLSSLNGSQLVGIYGVTTTTFPPVVESLALVLSKES